MRATISKMVLGLILVPSFILSSLGQSNQIQAQVDSLSSLANSIGLKNLDSVKLIAESIIEISSAHNYEFGIIKGKIHGAYYLLSRHQPDSALNVLTNCLTFFDQNNKYQSTIEHATALYYLSVLTMRAGRYLESEVHGSRAIEIFEAHDQHENVANTLRNIGTGKFNRNLDSQALKYYMEALRIKIKGNISPEKTTPELRSIAQVYGNMGQYENALNYHRRIAIIQMDNNFTHRLYEVYHEIGNDFQQLGNYDSALYYYNQSIDGAEKRSNKAFITINKLEIAKTLAFQGDYPASNSLLYDVVQNKNPSEHAWTKDFFNLLGNNYLRMGELNKAIKNARKAYEPSGNMGSWHMLSSASLTLASAYEKRGSLDSALYYLKQYSIHMDSIYNINHQKKLSSLYAEIENLENGLTIEEMARKQEISQLQNSRLRWIVLLSIGLAILVITILTLIYRMQKREQQIIHDQLQEEINLKKKDLYQQALHMIHLNNGYKQIEDNLKKIKSEVPGSQKDVQHVLRTIHMNGALEKEWTHFNEYFGSVHTEFFDNLHELYPKFTLLEKRLAGLIRMNMSNSEIARIMNIETASVKQAKYRLKKKLKVPEDSDVYDFIVKL